MSKKQEYIVRKYNKDGFCYDRRYYDTYAAAWSDTGRHDKMLICKAGSTYYDSNLHGWDVSYLDIIRVVCRK